jgi:hypothetical protein
MPQARYDYFVEEEGGARLEEEGGTVCCIIIFCTARNVTPPVRFDTTSTLS